MLHQGDFSSAYQAEEVFGDSCFRRVPLKLVVDLQSVCERRRSLVYECLMFDPAEGSASPLRVVLDNNNRTAVLVGWYVLCTAGNMDTRERETFQTSSSTQACVQLCSE